jgi:hypothetical protein
MGRITEEKRNETDGVSKAGRLVNGVYQPVDSRRNPVFVFGLGKHIERLRCYITGMVDDVDAVAHTHADTLPKQSEIQLVANSTLLSSDPDVLLSERACEHSLFPAAWAVFTQAAVSSSVK